MEERDEAANAGAGGGVQGEVLNGINVTVPNAKSRESPAFARSLLILKTTFGSTKDTKYHEKLKHYGRTAILQTGCTMMLHILMILFVFFVLFVDNCFI
ncbi:MAG: hypothetical protein HYV06_04710 [Deltaproteobacteria bacterium]|nr:hypothetical protein [Deltaproteobacteria bacterium]